MNKIQKYLFIAIISGSLVACGVNGEDRKVEKELDEASKAMEEMFEDESGRTQGVLKSLTDAVNQLSEKVDTIAVGDLKSMLPVEIPGMIREGYSASKKGIEGFSITYADSEFVEKDGGGTLILSITDIGNLRGFAALGLDVLDVEIDEENQDGFQRTGLYKGHKSFQKHERLGSSSSSEMMVFVDGRFVVKGDGSNITWDLLEDVFDSIPLKKLAKY